MPQNLRQLTAENVAKGNASQLMICIVIDTSYSMLQENRINIVNEGIKHFIESAKESRLAVDSLDLCLISCGGTDATIVQEFKNVAYITPPTFKADGGTPLAQAVDKALERINLRRTQWINNGIGIYKPWLIIMSDGQSDNTPEQLESTARKLQRQYSERKLKGMCIAVGNEKDFSDLKKFSPDGEIKKMNSLEINDFFDKLSMSVAAISESSPDDQDETGYDF